MRPAKPSLLWPLVLVKRGDGKGKQGGGCPAFYVISFNLTTAPVRHSHFTGQEIEGGNTQGRLAWQVPQQA